MFGFEIERLPTRYGTMCVVGEDSVIGRSLRIYGEWAQVEIETLAALIPDGGVIVDIGANIGTHALAFASIKPRSTVIALEPQPLAFAMLAANVIASGMSNIEPLNLAAGKALAVIDPCTDYGKVGNNVGAVSLVGAGRASAGTRAVPMTVVRLDDLPMGETVRFMKIDVEGMEAEVLRGALVMIVRDRPVIYFEVLTMAGLNACRRVLAPFGYELRWLETPAFNPDNFHAETQNIWGHGEVGVLAMPAADDARVRNLPLVTGNEATPPCLSFVQQD